jgi:hypothetical protein
MGLKGPMVILTLPMVVLTLIEKKPSRSPVFKSHNSPVTSLCSGQDDVVLRLADLLPF